MNARHVCSFCKSLSWQRLWRVGVVLALVALMNSGCDRLASKKEGTQDNGAAPVISTEELVKQVEKLRVDTEKAAQAASRRGGSSQFQLMRGCIQDGLTKSAQLLSQSELTPEQTELAQYARAVFLCLGCEHKVDGCAEESAKFAKDVEASAPQSRAAALLAAALVAQQIRGNLDFSAAMNAINNYAQRFPQSPTGIRLYGDLAHRLHEANRISETVQCCHAAIARYKNHPDTKRLHQMALQLQQRAVAARQQEASELAIKRQVMGQLGGRPNGYFVIWSEGSSGAWVPVDCQVTKGVRETTQYVRQLKKGWKWEVKAWYPETKAGLDAAMAKRRELMKKTISIPTFN